MPCVVRGMRIWLARAAHRYVPEYRLGWELPHQTQPWMTERAAHCLHKPQCKDTRRTPATTLQHTPAPIVQEVNVAPCKCTVAVDFDALCTITTLGGELSLLSSAMATVCGCRDSVRSRRWGLRSKRGICIDNSHVRDSVCQARNTCSLRFSCFPLLPVNCTWSPHRIDVSHCIVKRTQPYCQPASSLQPPQRQHGYGRRQSPPPPAALPRCRGREPPRGEAARAAHLRRPRILPVRFRMGA